MKYKAWDKAKSIEESFTRALNKLTSMFRQIAEQSEDLKEYQRKMGEFQNSEEFENFILSSVRRMVTPIAVMNMSTWRKAAKKATKNPLLYRVLLSEINEGLKSDIENQIANNALLIRTLPTDTANKVVNDIYKSTYEGKRSTTIAKEILKYTSKHAKASAKLIARTEVSKTMSALTQARSRNLGLNWYVWRTQEDGDRVRPSHRIMNDVLVNFSEPPSPELLNGEKSEGYYHAGNIWNCRCYEEPLLDIDDVKWPHKVYHNGNIQTMTKKQFEEIM